MQCFTLIILAIVGVFAMASVRADDTSIPRDAIAELIRARANSDEPIVDMDDSDAAPNKMPGGLPEPRAVAVKPANPAARHGASAANVDLNPNFDSQNSLDLPAKKKCLKLDPETGIGPDIIANFNFPDADIVEIAETLGRATCLNFIFDKEVKGHISIVNNSKITVGDAWKAFLTSLDMNGYAIVPSGNFLRIAKQRDAKDKQIKTYSGKSPDTDSYITRVLHLKYISAEEISRLLRGNFMSPTSRVIAYEQTNTLIITDTGSNVKKVVDLIDLLDVERFDERVEVIRIEYASATEVSKLLDQMLPGPGGQSLTGPGGIPHFGSSSALSGVRKTKEGGMISRIIPDERTNSIVVAANAEGLKEVHGLIAKLDTRVGSSPAGARIHVIFLQYADSEQVATTLNNLVNGGAGATAHPGSSIPGTNNVIGLGQLFESSIKLSADKATNSLVITGTQSDFATISSVVSKLDVPRDQVYVEAVIMETTLDKEFDLGTSVANPASGIAFLPNQDLAKTLANPLALSGLIMGFQTGTTRTYNIGGTNIPIATVQGLIHALQQNTISNILATPQILTLDNQDAKIEISENIPIPTSTAVQGAGVASSITYQKVALTLKIKPQINKASDFVKLDIDQQLDDISNRAPPKGVVDQAFVTSGRSSKTTVVVQDADTVVIGGLVRDKISETTSKIPLLGDIPILGWLFRSKTAVSLKQNLLVFITPHIIKQYQKMRNILDRKLRERDDFNEKNAGGDDPFKDQKIQMIKDLPAVADLKSAPRVQNIDEQSASKSSSGGATSVPVER